MPAETAILLALIALFVAPLTWASVFLRREHLRAIGELPNYYKRIRKESELERRLRGEYTRQQDLLIICRQSTAESTAKEKSITGKLSAAIDKLESIGNASEDQPSDSSLSRESEKLKETIAQLEKQQEEQTAKTLLLRNDLEELEAATQRAYMRMQVSTAKTHAESAAKKAEEILARNYKGQAGEAIAKMEAKVAEREAKAKAPRVPVPEKSQPQISEADAARIESLFNTSSKLIALSGGIASVLDPSMDRAYNRLNRLLKGSRKLASASLKEEDTLEAQLEIYDKQAVVWQQRLDEADREVSSDALEKLSSWKASDEAAHAELVLALQAHRKRNLLIGQRLFRIEGIVRRLYILKLLIAALPRSMKEEFEQYIKLTDALSRYLENEWRSENADSGESPDFANRLSTLERNTLMSFIRIAKSDRKELSAQSIVRLKSEISTMMPEFELEKSDQQVELDKWSALENQAIAGNKELLHAFASRRREQSATILKTVEQSIDVLQVILSRGDQQRK